MITPRNRSAAASRFRGDPGTVRELPARAVLVLLTAYRTAISPTRPPSCRYSPTCSAYAVQAIQRFGLVRGGWLAVRRLLRCHPFHAGGHDPVPEGVGRTGHPPAAPISRPAA